MKKEEERDSLSRGRGSHLFVETDEDVKRESMRMRMRKGEGGRIGEKGTCTDEGEREGTCCVEKGEPSVFRFPFSSSSSFFKRSQQRALI